jgi:hypothetical protein
MANEFSKINNQVYLQINNDIKRSLTIKNAVKRLGRKKATYHDINNVSKRVSKSISDNLKTVYKKAPEKQLLTFAGVNSVIGSKIKYGSDIINTFAKLVQNSLDEKTGRSLNVLDGVIPSERTYKILNAVIDNFGNLEKVQQLLSSPLKNVIGSSLTSFIDNNASFRERAGVKTYVSRFITSDTACSWCVEMAYEGTYSEFKQNSNNSLGQHDNCTCEIEMWSE